MILAKVYKTLVGAQRRASFETGISKTHDYHTIRFLDGVADVELYSATVDKDKRYTWRVAKAKRRRIVVS